MTVSPNSMRPDVLPAIAFSSVSDTDIECKSILLDKSKQIWMSARMIVLSRITGKGNGLIQMLNLGKMSGTID